MPEQNFEQQARDMAEDFRMEPQLAVWQNVKNAIAKPKRKRRILIWWWLLPLGLLGGSVLFIRNHKNDLTKDKEIASATQKKSSSITKNPQVAKEEKLLSSKDETSTGKIEKNQKYDEVRVSIKTNKNNFSKEETDENYRTYKPDSSFKKNEIESHRIEIEENKVSSIDSNNIKPLALHKEESIVGIDVNSIANLITKLLINNIKTALGSSFFTTLNPLQIKDSLQKKSDSTATVTSKKKQNTKLWHWGILAETGLTSLGNNPFQNKSFPNPFAFDASPVNSNVGAFNRSTISRQIKHGAYMALGAALKRNLSDKISFDAQVSYKYQQFAITENVTIDTSRSTSAGNISRFVYYTFTETQKAHFVNIYTGFNWQFLKWKQSGLSFGAGLDNSCLVALQQKSNNTLQFQTDSLKSASVSNFYRWQPFVNASVSFHVSTGKSSGLQLSPLVRFGLGKYQKNSAGYTNNHLVSAGFQAIYFFK